jgi:hypothetical protein
VTSVAYDTFSPTWSGEFRTATAAELLVDGIGFDGLERDLRAGRKVSGRSGGLLSVTSSLTRR